MDRRYAGIDLHRRRSVIYAMDAEGEKLFCERIDNDALRLLEVVSAAGDGAEVVIEATYGWYWAVDLLREAGFSVHLAHPSGNDWGKRRVKNDERDARDLADLLRLVASRKHGSHHQRFEKHGSWSAIERGWCSSAAASKRRCTR
jgi:transposase